MGVRGKGRETEPPASCPAQGSQRAGGRHNTPLTEHVSVTADKASCPERGFSTGMNTQDGPHRRASSSTASEQAWVMEGDGNREETLAGQETRGGVREPTTVRTDASRTPVTVVCCARDASVTSTDKDTGEYNQRRERHTQPLQTPAQLSGKAPRGRGRGRRGL